MKPPSGTLLLLQDIGQKDDPQVVLQAHHVDPNDDHRQNEAV